MIDRYWHLRTTPPDQAWGMRTADEADGLGCARAAQRRQRIARVRREIALRCYDEAGRIDRVIDALSIDLQTQTGEPWCS